MRSTADRGTPSRRHPWPTGGLRNGGQHVAPHGAPDDGRPVVPMEPPEQDVASVYTLLRHMHATFPYEGEDVEPLLPDHG